ncbi:hypothetical protein BDR26DRAFT_922431 [Obelidium mucronatum]|nr:hypothetical protein BDR26DRAFT_922431 [Obelidium mucronatum]
MNEDAASDHASPATPRSKSKSLSILHNPLAALGSDGPPVPKLPSAHRLTFADAAVEVPPPVPPSPPPPPLGSANQMPPPASKVATLKRSYSLKTPTLGRRSSSAHNGSFKTGIINRDEEEEEEAAAAYEIITSAQRLPQSIPKVSSPTGSPGDWAKTTTTATATTAAAPAGSHHGLGMIHVAHDVKPIITSDDDEELSVPTPIKLSVVSKSDKRRGSILAAASNSLQRTLSKASKHKKDMSVKSHGSSLNISNDMLARTLRLYEKYRALIVNSGPFQFIYGCAVSTKFQIYVFTLFHTLDLVLITVLLPSIGYYNLVHAVLGSLGKVGFFTGYGATYLIAKEYVASSLVKKGKGVPLSTVAVPPTQFNPPEGATLRTLFVGSLFVVEGAMWYLILLMQWTPVSTALGEFDCIPATYPTRPKLLANVPGFLQGDTSLGVLYNYGLPLQDGLIGGWSAWPLAAPSRKFDVEGPGIVYAYMVSCGDLRRASNDTSIASGHPERIEFQLDQSELWTNMYTAMISVRFPARMHNWEQESDHDVIQKCTIAYVMGEGRIKFTFVADEWEMVTGGQIGQIWLEDQVLHKKDPASIRYFHDVSQYLGPTDKHIEVVDWFVEAFGDCVNNTFYEPTQQGGLVNMYQWGVQDGKYDMSQTWQGIAGGIGAMSHYILMQYNGSEVASCRYSGIQHSGIIDIPEPVALLMLSTVIICFVTQTMQLLRWALTSGGSAKTDQVALILNSPLLLLYYMRASITSLIPDIKSGDHSTRSIRLHMKTIFVRLGEDKKTRGEPVGNLIISTPKNVLAMSDKREYN